ncbi:MAG: stalk domain-containing protein [Bacillota bacterium]|nr:stalk domain-containing protein [Bacillota bacterium]
MKAKKTLFLLMVLLILALKLNMALAQPKVEDAKVTITIDNSIQYFEVPPVIVDGRTLVPLRAIFEGLGAVVDWESQTKKITATKGNDKIILHIGRTDVTINGQSSSLEVPAMIVNGSTMVPVRFIAESFGAEVLWYEQERHISIIQADKSLDSSFENLGLKGIKINQEKQEVVDILGQPLRVEVGPMGTEWWTYHQDYDDFYLIIFLNQRVVSFYTNQEAAEYNGIVIGGQKPEAPESSAYRNGNLIIRFANNETERSITMVNNSLVLYYLDNHQSDKVVAIRVIAPEFILQGYQIIGYSYSYLFPQDLPQVIPSFNAQNQTLISSGQANILFDLTNTARKQHQIPILKWNDQVALTAFKHSRDMFMNSYFSHESLDGKSPFDRMKEDQIKFKLAAENLSVGYRMYDAIEAHHGLMNSAGHRLNILNKALTELGVGSYFDKDVYFTQKFITP